MARVTIEDCLEKIPNRFEIVEVASKRARQLSFEGASPLVTLEKNNKNVVIALREIAEGKVGMQDTAAEKIIDELDSEKEIEE